MKNARTIQVCLCQALIALVLLVVTECRAQQTSFSISAGGASMQLNLSGSGAGISNWSLNGVNQLLQQWYYYSVDGGAVYSIDNIGLVSSTESTFAGNTTVDAIYSNSMLQVTVASTLKPGNAGQSIFSSNISVYNPSGVQHDYALYQYSDFALGSGSGNQTVQFAGTGVPYKVTQTSSTGESLVGTLGAVSGGSGDLVLEQAGLTDGNQFGILNGAPSGPTLNGTLTAGTGNVDFAYEVNGTLNSGATGLSFVEVQTVPEPSAIALLLPGVLGFGLYYGRKSGSFKKVVKKLHFNYF